MGLNLRKIQQLDAQQILEILLPTINNLYKTVDYVGISEEEFYNLLLREIDKSKKTYKGDIIYIEYIKSRMNIVLVEKNLLEPETAIIIINNYINKRLKKSVVYDDSIKNLKKLDTFFETYNYIPNPDVLLSIIEENSTVSKMIESIIKKHKSQIISGNLEKIFDNSTIVLMVEIYCMLNNIEIKQSEDFKKDSIDSENAELTNSVKTYLQEIDRRPLLSLEEERKLAQRMSQGDSYARKIFIESNLKLVVSIAKKYMNRGLPFLDLIQEGNLGLMKAVDKYDVSREIKFSTCATWWIRQAITRALAKKGRNIKVSVNMYEKINAYKKTMINLEKSLNRQPTINEMANEMELSIPKVKQLQKLQSDTISLNILIDDDTELENFIPASVKTPEDVAIVSTMQHQVRKLLEDCNLKPREIEVLMLRFGFNDRAPMEYEEIGKKFDMSREWARRIELKALMQIRKSKHIKAFADYMQNPDKALENIDFFREKYRETGNPYKRFLGEGARIQEKEKMRTLSLNQRSESQEKRAKSSKKEQKSPIIESSSAISTGIIEEPIVESSKSSTSNIEMLDKKIKSQNEYNPVAPPIAAPLKTQADSKNITKEEYVRMLELFHTQEFKDMTKSKPEKECMILSLAFGYMEGKCYSATAIANFFDLEVVEVISIIKKGFVEYREILFQKLDYVMEQEDLIFDSSYVRMLK